ncbi:hypothetical protein CBL_08489 [Carabus blaptoides fortunei]
METHYYTAEQSVDYLEEFLLHQFGNDPTEAPESAVWTANLYPGAGQVLTDADKAVRILYHLALGTLPAFRICGLGLITHITVADRRRTSEEVCLVFNEKYPNRTPLTRSTLSRLIKKFETSGSIKDLERTGRPKSAASIDKTLDILLSIEENPQVSTRQIALDHNISHESVRTALKREHLHPYKGTLTAAKYLELLQNEIMPVCQALFPQEEFKRIWFQQDGAPPHYGAVTGDYRDEMNLANFIKYLREKITVLDNASDDNVQELLEATTLKQQTPHVISTTEVV